MFVMGFVTGVVCSLFALVLVSKNQEGMDQMEDELTELAKSLREVINYVSQVQKNKKSLVKATKINTLAKLYHESEVVSNEYM